MDVNTDDTNEVQKELNGDTKSEEKSEAPAEVKVENKDEVQNNLKGEVNGTDTSEVITNSNTEKKDEDKSYKNTEPNKEEETEVIKAKSKQGYCGICGKYSQQSCSQCKHVYYCSRDCQRKDWKTHKSKCRQNTIQKHQICDRITMASKHANTVLDTKIVKLKKLIQKNTEHGKNANEISTIILWIATNHPEILKENTKELQNVSVERLHFIKSWELLDELVPTEALITLLNSKVCEDLSSFCGYVNTEVLKHFPCEVFSFTVRLALGNLINNGTLLEELRSCRERIHNKMKTDPNAKTFDGNIIIHLRCGELKIEDLSPLPDFRPQVYISNVSDDGTTWVIQAVTALLPDYQPIYTGQNQYIVALYLPRSTLTAAGVEAIAKGLSQAGIIVVDIKISSSNVNADTKIPGYEYSDEFCRMITKKYFNEDYGTVSFTDIKYMNFTDFQEFIPSNLTFSLIDQLSKMKAGESDSDELEDTEEYKVLQAVLMEHFDG